MAQNDDYVQSEGLNVSNKKTKSSSDVRSVLQTESSSVVENLSDKFVDALSSAAKPKYRTRDAAVSTGVVVSQDETGHFATSAAHKPKLVSSVAAMYDQELGNPRSTIVQHTTKSGHNSHKPKSHKQSYAKKPSSEPTGVIVGDKHAHILHQLHYESDDSSDDGYNNSTNDDTGDFELERNNSLSDELERELNETLLHQYQEKRKDPHRFMSMTADLEERETLFPSCPPPTNHTISKAEFNANNVQEATTAGQETRRALDAGLSWVKNVASPQLQAISKQIIAKVAENEGGYFPAQGKSGELLSSKPMIGPRHGNPKTSESEDDDIIMTSSSTFLADDDMAELERIRSKHSSSQMTVLVKTCLESLSENPRLAFVAATLIFALFVYYYSRKRSVDDVL